MPARRTFPLTLFVLLSGSAVFFTGSVAAPAILARVGAEGVASGAMTAAVQAGFVVGTLLAVLFDLPDRLPARRLLAILLVAGAAANALLLTADTLVMALTWRFIAGVLAGPIYPIGMRLLATWYASLGPRLGILLGVYTFGAGAAAVLRTFQTPVTAAIIAVSAVAIVAAVAVSGLHAGPLLPARQGLDAKAMVRAYQVPAYRWSSFGYFGHMWELFAFWGLLPFWLEAAGWTGARGQALLAGTYVAGALGCLWAGGRSRRTGAGRVARLALGTSGVLCLASPWLFAAPDGLLAAGILLWGWMVIADSPMFSALSAQAAPAAYVGSALTIQNSIGFAIPIMPLFLIPWAASSWGWGPAFALLAIGPVLGWPFTQRLSRPPHPAQGP